MNKEDVKALREKMGLTQTELAYKIGVDYHTVMSWEKGYTQPSRMAKKLLEMLTESVNEAAK